MNVLDLEGEVEIRDENELLRRLRTVRKGADGAFVLSVRTDGPQLWLHINGDIAYVHYFPGKPDPGSGCGFMPVPIASSTNAPVREVRFLLTDGSEGSAITPNAAALIAVERGYQIAIEFFHYPNLLPRSITWLEL